MNKSEFLFRFFSFERLQPYLTRHQDDMERALHHYKSNILISESFYPLLAILEIGLRNAIDYQLTMFYHDYQWFDNDDFIKVASRFQLNKISDAKTTIIAENKEITSGRIISELNFGFWTSLFDARFEMSLWKNLRMTFPNCPKNIRQRKQICTKFNSIRKLRNRIFHHEAISWNLQVLNCYKIELLEGISWLDKDMMNWVDELNHINEVIDQHRIRIAD